MLAGFFMAKSKSKKKREKYYLHKHMFWYIILLGDGIYGSDGET